MEGGAGEFAEADDAHLHAAFVQTFRDMLRGLNVYVRTFHSKGVSWNMDGACLLQRAALGQGLRAVATCEEEEEGRNKTVAVLRGELARPARASLSDLSHFL